MCAALEVLRDVDRHFQHLTGVDVPGQSRAKQTKGALGQKIEERDYIESEHYDLWRRVRSAMASLEREGC